MRFLAFIFLILTVTAVFFDYRAQAVDESLELPFAHQNDLLLRPVANHWQDIDTASLQQAQPAIERHVSPWLWENIIQPVLETPAAIVFGIAFLFFYLLGILFRRPRRAYNTEPL